MHSDPGPTGVLSELSALTSMLGTKFDDMADRQADSNQHLVNILMDAIKSGQTGQDPVADPSLVKKFYAVSVGRQLGVFTRWKEVRVLIHGFAGARMKRFRTREVAQKWFDEQQALVKSESDDEYDSDATYTEPLAAMPRTGRVAPVPPCTPPGIRDIVDA